MEDYRVGILAATLCARNRQEKLHASVDFRVLKIIAEQAAIFTGQVGDVKPEHELEANLGFDELDYIETMIALEEEFDIILNDEAFDQLKTVQQVIEHVTGVCNAGTVQAAA